MIEEFRFADALLILVTSIIIAVILLLVHRGRKKMQAESGELHDGDINKSEAESSEEH